jgi:hypothetical protein
MIGEVEQEPFVCYFPAGCIHRRYILGLKLIKIYVEDYLGIGMYLHAFLSLYTLVEGFCHHLDQCQNK